ncbi:MAG: PAS domain S-box protein, partial [Chlorobi bacterium]|nr:PAS domain S-box protein [Chlorobiota bacterium]
VNTSACELTGYTKEELLGETIRFLMFPEDLSAVEDDPYLYVASQTPRERRIRRKDGTEIWVDHRISVFDIDGEPQLLVISKDITQERRLRRELEFEHAFTESVIKSIEPMRVVDVDSWQVVSLNPKAEEFYRQADTAGEVVSCQQVGNPDAQCTERDCPLHLALEQQQPVPVERYLPKMDRWVWLCGYPFTVRDRRYVAEVVRDITEQKKLEEHVAQAQKMDAIGTLAGGIAHDFNNLLGGIIGFTSLMRMRLDKESPLLSTVDGIEKSARRAAALTEQLLGFTRAGGRKVESVDLNSIVDSVIELIGRTFQKHVTVKKSLQSGLWKIEGDSAQFEHCLLNLCINARDAMPDGGTLTITTANVTVKRDGSKLGRVLQPGPYVLLKVADTGVGMTPDIKSHIFEPFFSTKPKGKGTGLGLAMVYGIVKAYHGHINVESEVGQGSVFSLYFPAAKEPAVAEPRREEREPEQGTGMIILADDEDVMREVTKEILEALGYSVIDTPDGNDVMPLLEKYADRVSCVILDVLMPGISGIEIYKQIRDTYNNVKVLITSGYYPEGEARELIESEDVVFLQKPFTVEQLSQTLAEIIGSEPR